MRRTPLALLLLLAQGCSWAFVSTAPSSAQPGDTPPVVCTVSRNAPVADVVIAVLGAVATASLYAQCGGADPADDCNSTWSLGLIYGAGAVLLNGLSAEYGFRHTSRCRRVHAQPATPIGALPTPPRR